MGFIVVALIAGWIGYTLYQKQPPQLQPHPLERGMDEAEARKILGVFENASEQEIHEAYKGLIKKLHPDTGGSQYLTALVIQAKNKLEKNNGK